jgi:glycerol-3-phosphate acyltransferase PlsY
MLWWIAASSFLIVVKHHANVQRLLAGTETKFRAGRT